MYRICRISSTIADDGCDWFRGKVYGLKLGERRASDLREFLGGDQIFQSSLFTDSQRGSSF